jgi:hypothetical protein
MNTTLEYSTRVVHEGDRRCKKSTLNDLAYLTPLRIPLMNPVSLRAPQHLSRMGLCQTIPKCLSSYIWLLLWKTLGTGRMPGRGGTGRMAGKDDTDWMAGKDETDRMAVY